MATALSEEELDNEDYYSLLNVRREVRPVAWRRRGRGQARWLWTVGRAAVAPQPPRQGHRRARSPRDPAAVRARQPSSCPYRRDPRALARVQRPPRAPRPVRGVHRAQAGLGPTQSPEGDEGPGEVAAMGYSVPATLPHALPTHSCPRLGVRVISLSQQVGERSPGHQGQGHTGVSPELSRTPQSLVLPKLSLPSQASVSCPPSIP